VSRTNAIELGGEFTGLGDRRLLFRPGHLNDVRHQIPLSRGETLPSHGHPSAYEWTLVRVLAPLRWGVNQDPTARPRPDQSEETGLCKEGSQV
jgi:hypothetical protein